ECRSRGTNLLSKAAGSSLQNSFESCPIAALLRLCPQQRRTGPEFHPPGNRRPATQPGAETPPVHPRSAAESGTASKYPYPFPNCTSRQEIPRNRNDGRASSAAGTPVLDRAAAARRDRAYG